MRKYWAFYVSGLQNALVYRGQMLFWFLGDAVSVVMMLSLWLSVSATGLIAGYTKSELITYYILSLLLDRIIGFFPGHWVRNKIKSGEIIGDGLLKPVSYYFVAFMAEASWHSVTIFIGIISAAAFAIFFKDNFLWLLTFDKFFVIAAATALGIIIVFSTSFILGLLAFYFTEASIFEDVYFALLGLLGGVIVPVSFFPQQVKFIIDLLPFRFVLSFPLEIYLGKLSPTATLEGFIIGLSWAALLITVYKFVWARGVKAYNAWGQ